MSRRPRSSAPRRSAHRARARFPGWLAAVVAVGSLAILAWWAWHPGPAPQATPAQATRYPHPKPLRPDAEVHAGYGGSASCRECHEEAFQLWAGSHHALAERRPAPAMDRAAFNPNRSFNHGTQTTSVREHGGVYEVITLGLQEQPQPYAVGRVIGESPLRQFLTPFPGGRWQTLEASYDPRSNDWFNVYGREDRQPGEWGHWTGRGMNWNAMCAVCHNTRLRKHYDPATDAYETSMVEPGVGCESCHGPMKDHNEWQRKFKDQGRVDPTIRKFPRPQMLATCGGCHARRVELSGDFVPGDDFFDHHALTLVDSTDIYYPDGQVREEDYEFAAFLGSRMHAAGVVCTDCHNPHSMKPILPGNLLCMRCHDGGHPKAPPIDPVKHSFHKVFNPGVGPDGQPVEIDLLTVDYRNIKETGGECVNCHMPQTVYMQRHWRHDHGFTIPDPLLSQEHGIPNACNRCHQDKDVAWSLRYVEEWYGKKMDRPYRRRAETVAAARSGRPGALPQLRTLLATEEHPYWLAVAANLSAGWLNDPGIASNLTRLLSHTNALVRGEALHALAALSEPRPPHIQELLRRGLADPVRFVRWRAAEANRATLDLDSAVGLEYAASLDHQSDQPGGQMQWAALALARGDLPTAIHRYEQAVTWDPNSAPIRHDLAIAFSQSGRTTEAIRQLEEACRLAPEDPDFAFRLGLAWNEAGNLDQTLRALERAVAIDPGHSRAWYNLGLARNQKGEPQAALQALQRAEQAAPGDPNLPYARATILLAQGRREEAAAAAQRTLEIAPDFQGAAAILRALSQP